MIDHETLLECLRYEPDTGRFFWRKKLGPRAMPGNEAGSLNQTGYVKIKVLGIEYTRSRLAWFYVHSEWPNPYIDHINRNRSDDRICNLRVATRRENNCNTTLRSDNTTGVKGVIRHNSGYMARINYRGESIYLGMFDDLDDAGKAVQEAAKNITVTSLATLSRLGGIYPQSS